MKTTYIATIALLLASLGSSYAIADDSTQPPSRAKVLAELAEAKRTGDLIDGHSGKKLNELYPSLYPAKAAEPGVTRAQVLAELAEAKRTGELVDGHSGKKLNELYPSLYPAKTVQPGATRAQVLAELAEAMRTGDLVDGRTGKKLKELYPGQYAEKSIEILPGEPIAAGRQGSNQRR